MNKLLAILSLLHPAMPEKEIRLAGYPDRPMTPAERMARWDTEYKQLSKEDKPVPGYPFGVPK